MATYYFEGQQILAPFTIESVQVVLSSETVSGKIFKSKSKGQRWDLSFNIITNEPAAVFAALLEDDVVEKSMIMPQLLDVDKALENAAQYYGYVNGGVSSGSTVVPMTSILGLLPQGSFIQFSGHDKIYTVLNSLTTSGNANIYPALQKDLANGTQIKLPNSVVRPSFHYKRSVDTLAGMVFTDGIIANPGTITLNEVV
jgi:hypothetical protein